MSYFPGISDHDIVFFTGHMRVLRSKSEKVIKKFPGFNCAQDESILDLLEQDFDIFEHKHAAGSSTIDDLWIHFRNTVNECISKHVPTRQKKNATIRILGSRMR